MRTDRQGPPDRPQREPRQQQDQARVPAHLQNVTLLSEKLDKSFKFRVSTHGLRSVEHNGGLDNWLLKTSDEKLSTSALKVKRELKKAGAAA